MFSYINFQTDSNISLVTEHVVPLSNYINEEDDRNEYEISWGLHQILVMLS